MKEIDFRVGDKVYHFEYGNGTVTRIKINSQYPIEVGFENAETFDFTPDGRIYTQSKRRSLFHGHNLEFTVNENLPVRFVSKWVYLYIHDCKAKASPIHCCKRECEAGIGLSVYPVLSGPIEIKLPEEN